MHFQLPHLRDSDAHQARDQGANARWHEGLGQEADGKAQGKAGRKGTEHALTISLFFFKFRLGPLEY